MVMQSMRKGRGSSVIKFIFLSLLVLATGGLVLSDVGGFFRGGVSSNDVATVGNDTIGIMQFDRSVRRSIARLNLTPQQAYQLGYINQILNSEISNKMLLKSSQNLGFRVGDELAVQKVSQMLQPMVENGQTAKDVLQQILASQGMSEAELLGALSSELSRTALVSAIGSGAIGTSKAMNDTLFQYENEMRNLKLITQSYDSYKIKEPASKDVLTAFYEASKERYAIPETRVVQIATILYDDLVKDLAITEEELREVYNDEIANFEVPEKRVLEQLIVSNASEGDDVITLVHAGKSLEDAAKQALGNADGYLAPEAYEAGGVLEEVRSDVFSANKGDVVGPVDTALGTYIVVLKDVEDSKTQSFETVEEQLRKELTSTKLQDAQFERASALDDMLARGLSLEEIKKEIPLSISELPPIPKQATLQGSESLKEYGDDAQNIIDLAYSYEEGEISPVTDLSDGSAQYVVHIQTVNPKGYKPFSEMRDAVQKSWEDQQKTQGVRKILEEYRKTLMAEGAPSFDSFVKSKKLSSKVLKNITRKEDQPEPLKNNALALLFVMEVGDVAIVETTNGLALVQITQISLPEPQSADAEALSAIRSANVRDAQNEAMMLFLEAQKNQLGVRVNNELLKQVYGSSNNAQAGF